MRLRLAISITILLKNCYASSGDQDPKYLSCIRSCQREQCISPTLLDSKFTFPVWSCAQTCQFSCMKDISQLRIQRGLPVLKYYGHWSFEHHLGLEEPASVLFSAMNFVPHFMYIVYNYRQTAKYSDFMSPWLLVYALSACNAWIASTLFHCQKSDWATQYDYMSALVFLACGLVVCLRRLMGTTTNTVTVSSVVMAIGLCICKRLYDMSRGAISFSDHMSACICLVVLTTTLWGIWMLVTGDSSIVSRRHRGVCLLCQLWLVMASALEVFDFPPYWSLFDAHSLWHAATIPLGYVWYWHFWSMDRQYRQALEIGQQQKDKLK